MTPSGVDPTHRPIGAITVSDAPVYVGLDYHQNSVQVCVLDRDGKVLANTPCQDDWRAITAPVHKHSNAVRAAVEACTGSADLADELVAQAGWHVDLAHPGYVARMKQGPDQTDSSDARMLADLERVGYLPRVWLAPQEVRELRRLVRYRQQLAAERRSTKLRVGALLREGRIKSPVARAWGVAWVRWLRAEAELPEQTRWVVDRQLVRLGQLDEEIAAVEDRLSRLTADDPLVQRMLAMKGIGLVTATTIRAEVGRFDRFRSGKQLARFCGLSPRNASSGQRQADAGLIKAGNPQLRTALIEAAHRLMRYDERWSKLNVSMRARGKPGSVVAAAVANRWVRWLYHQMQPPAEAA
jgi:transposase